MAGYYEQTKALAKELGVSVKDVIALDVNNDPYYIGTPAHAAKAEWFTAMWKERGFVGRGGVHLRRAHYQILGSPKHDGTPYQNHPSDFNYLIAGARFARILGKVDPEDIIDRRNPEPHIFLQRPELEEEPGVEVYTSEMALPRVEVDLLAELDEDLEPPFAAVSGYTYDDFYQPYHIEVWAEKSTMNDILEPLCRRMSTNLVTGVGYMTITSIIALLRRIEATGKPARILYISDADKAGKQMPVQVGTQVRFWMEEYLPDADIRLQPIVLTPEQIAKYGLDELAITDEETGEEKVELDALESLHPGELGNIVSSELRKLQDRSLRRRYAEARQEAQEAADEALAAELADELEELEEIWEEAQPIVERYQRLFERLGERMDRELEPLSVKLEALSPA